ncbi:Cof-type HAD-IIB family hydrolase [Bacillus sp. JCM 19034]|uniref:Cof-type HAD-IIB family hydrolase n=1 Tax=Bacillus sp. JCM 19034 TaxID=1481928 RepID=UPI0007854228|nr:Cof-type HAD-IIB family hydrolase [Bacillus sp. JCM 19034]
MKIIATDLDGTLLNDKHKISEKNAQAIRQAQKEGMEVVVATGRSYSAAHKPLNEAGLDCPIICLNGARIYTINGENIYDAPLERSSCFRIQQACNEEGLYFEVFTNKGGFSDSRDKFVQVMVDITLSANPNMNRENVEALAKQRFQDEEIEVIENFEALFNNPDIIPYKILAFSILDQELEAVHNRLKDDKDLAISSSGFSNLEFNHPKAQKGIALSFYANEKGIDMKDVMAIGDNFNDESMLRMAGFGVAMGNAEEGIKEICDFVTKTNLEDGVAHAIAKVLS